MAGSVSNGTIFRVPRRDNYTMKDTQISISN